MLIRTAIATLLALGGTSAAGAGPLLFPNSDFETGTLENWRAEGTAFNHQPTAGDNAQVREPSFRTLHMGNWWIGTYEAYNAKPGQKPGGAQGDAPIGGLMSQSFLINGPYITFLVGGGRSRDVGVQLIVGGEITYFESGTGTETMRRVYWDVRPFLNRQAFIYVMDNSDGAWQHINADDFRYADAAPKQPLFPNSDFESGDLTNWTAAGAAMETQPTKGDNASVRRGAGKGAEPQGTWWIGTYENFRGREGQTPGDIQKDIPVGTLRSIPFKIEGPVIAFRLGAAPTAECGVRLLVNGREERVMRGIPMEWMSTSAFYVEDLVGAEGVIEIFDDGAGSWGHINADDFHYGRLDLHKQN